MAKGGAGGRRTRFQVRELEASDLERGLLETLANLGDLEGLTLAEARRVFRAIKGDPVYHVFVAVEPGGQVIGATTLIIEQKFIHRGGSVGHVEDVVVRNGFEGAGVGSSLVRKAVETARGMGCYKCILDCKPELVGFYEGLGFESHDVGMRVDLKRGPKIRSRPR